jgi:hypothetical protein
MDQSPLKLVSISRASVEAMMVHALTTEKEEVMGLLFGEIIDREAHVYQVYILSRSGKADLRCN